MKEKSKDTEEISAMKKRREELGMTQRELASKAGLTVQTISNIETGRYKAVRLEPSQFKQVCKALQWERIEQIPDNWLPI